MADDSDKLALGVPLPWNFGVGPSSVFGLFRSCRPAAIARFIVAVIVDSVEGMLWGGRFAHVSQKCLKSGVPLRAYRDASAAVSGKHFEPRVATSGAHAQPRSICGGNFPTRGFVVGCHAFALKAAAAFVLAQRKVCAAYSLFVPAVTYAIPAGLGAKVCASSKDGHAPKLLARNVNESTHSSLHKIEADNIMGSMEVSIG